MDERAAIPSSIQDAALESLHLTHPDSWGIITLGQYAFWTCREILNKAAKCRPCTEMGKNPKPVIPASIVGILWKIVPYLMKKIN